MCQQTKILIRATVESCRKLFHDGGSELIKTTKKGKLRFVFRNLNWKAKVEEEEETIDWQKKKEDYMSQLKQKE